MSRVQRSKSSLISVSMMAIVVAGSASCGDDENNRASKVASKVRECGVASEGRLNIEQPIDDAERCIYDCFAAASCADVTTVYCEETDEPVLSAEYLQCARACFEAHFAFECDGQKYDQSAKCDGVDDCQDGSDEAGCAEQEYFECGGDDDSIPLEDKCDGFEDCLNGQDERGCDYDSFTCKNGEKLAAEFECDLEIDCEDESDEHEGCAKLTCDAE